MTVFLPHDLKTVAAASASGVLGAGAKGCVARAAMVLISLWKWCEKAGWKEDMRDWRWVPFRAVGEGRVERYVEYSDRPCRKDSVMFVNPPSFV